MRSKQAGNAIVVILIAVFLFGALAAVFMRGARTGQGQLTDNQARIAAQELIDYGQKVEKAIDKLRVKGCSETGLSFANTVYRLYNNNIIYNDGHNPNAPVTGECDIFKTSGAGLVPRLFQQQTVYVNTLPLTSTGHGSAEFRTARVPGVGDPAKDELLFTIPVVQTDVCAAINKILGVANHASGRPPVAQWSSSAYSSPFFPGTMTIVDDEGAISGKTAFCSRYSTGADVWNNSFFQVLIIR